MVGIMTTPLVAQEGKGIPSTLSNGAAGIPAVIVILKELVPEEDRVATGNLSVVRKPHKIRSMRYGLNMMPG